MNGNANKLTRALLVATPAATMRAATLSGLEREAPQSSISDQAPASGSARHPAKLGKANSHFFSFHNSGASDASVFPFGVAGLASRNAPIGVYRRQGTRWYGETKQGRLESEAIQAG